MQYGCVAPAVFLSRPNRFIARVQLGEQTVECHVKNTGRCRELLVPGATVYLERGTNPNRRTAWDLIAADKGGKLINMDAQAPNRVFAQWARERWADVRPEVRYGRSRLDFCLDGHHLVEVKGVTLEQDGRCRFPDAPTERGTRHLHELIRAVEEGYQATAFFVIQMENALDFAPNDDTDPAFGQALRQAARAGVEIAAYSCRVTPGSIEMDRPVPVLLLGGGDAGKHADLHSVKTFSIRCKGGSSDGGERICIQGGCGRHPGNRLWSESGGLDCLSTGGCVCCRGGPASAQKHT